jgi:hypothetical protein
LRALRIAALGLLPLTGACWMERPNLQSTGGGYTANAAVSRPVEADDHGAVETADDPAETRPAPLSP